MTLIQREDEFPTEVHRGDRNATKLVAISGSLRLDSYNTRIVRMVAEQAPPGVQITPYAGLRGLPPYDPDEDAGQVPDAVVELRRLIVAADGVVIVTPEYNYSIPGQLKNAIDWLSWPAGGAPLTRKPVAIAGATVTASGTAYAQLALRQILLATQSPVLLRPEVRISAVHERFDPSGLIDEAARQLLADLVQGLVDMITGNRVTQ